MAMLTTLDEVRSIVFDLDGTLYVAPSLAEEIWESAVRVVAESRGIGTEKGAALLRKARAQLADLIEEEPTLTRTCMELGIEVAELHRAFQQGVHPERHLSNDPVLFALLDSLADHCDLYLYTNNNLPLTQKILALLGVEDLFNHLYTIEFGWSPKPDPDVLQKVLEDSGGPPESFLFVGDRRQVDLKVPEGLGIPTLLASETADLLLIHKLLGIIP